MQKVDQSDLHKVFFRMGLFYVGIWVGNWIYYLMTGLRHGSGRG
jgi:hypothetical protein